MSITSDIREYADTAIDQARTQFTGITGTARTNVSGLTSKATDAVTDLRSQAEKTLNIDAIRTAVEPYLEQAKLYRSSVTDRAEGLFGTVYETVYGTVTSDKRVARVIDTVTERVVKPVSSLTGIGTARKPTVSAPSVKKPAAKKPAASKQAASKQAASKAPAKKTTKAATTRPAAKKAPAKKATS